MVPPVGWATRGACGGRVSVRGQLLLALWSQVVVLQEVVMVRRHRCCRYRLVSGTAAYGSSSGGGRVTGAGHRSCGQAELSLVRSCGDGRRRVTDGDAPHPAMGPCSHLAKVSVQVCVMTQGVLGDNKQTGGEFELIRI